MNMTYRDLLKQLKELSDKQLNMAVMVFDDGAGEYYTIDDPWLRIADKTDNLPFRNPYMFLGCPARNFYAYEDEDDA